MGTTIERLRPGPRLFEAVACGNLVQRADIGTFAQMNSWDAWVVKDRPPARA